jgi:thiol-disulfide isomerase/thioredoxin
MLATLVLAALGSVFGSRGEGPFQDLTLDQALAAAKRDNKVVMIDFFTTWCGPCKKLDKTTWTDPEVQKWLAEQTVALRLDAEKETDLAKKQRIDAYPTMLFLKPDGGEIDRLVGYEAPKEFLANAKDALAGKNGVSRAKEKLAGHEEDPMLRERYAKELERTGRYEEALAEYLWCFDEGAKKSPAYVGVRGSFLLGDIAGLGKKYPPARKALEDRRDSAESRLSAGSGSFSDVEDAFAINRELNASERNLALYDRVRGQKAIAPDLRIVFAQELLAPLVEARRYQDALDLFDSPEKYVSDRIRMSKFLEGRKTGNDKEHEEMDDFAQEMMRGETVSQCADVYEALLGAKNESLAGKVADQLIAFAPTGHTYATLIASAVHAQANDAAKALAERGLASVPEKEKREVTRAAKRIPTAK